MINFSINRMGFDNFCIEDENGKEILFTDSTGINYMHDQVCFALGKKCMEDLEEEIDKKHDQLTDLEQENCSYEDEIQELKEENWELREKIKALQEELEKVSLRKVV